VGDNLFYAGGAQQFQIVSREFEALRAQADLLR
jgi:hypothetical protein